MKYYHRALETRINTLAKSFSAIAIEGPKAVGKTATALRYATTVFRLDDGNDRSRLLASSLVDLTRRGPVLIDDWQMLPESWNLVRRAVDEGAPPGSIFLTGSATPRDGVTTHSGAGRIMSVRMRPLALCETTTEPVTECITLGDLLRNDARAIAEQVAEAPITGTSSFTLDDYCDAMYFGGFPGAQHLDQASYVEFLNAYADRIIDRELPQQGYTARNREGLRSWLRAYTSAEGTDANYTTILDAATRGDGAKPSRRTTDVYREKLSEIWLLDPLEAWNYAPNPIPRAVTSPKHYLADTGLALTLLGIAPRTLNSSAFASRLGQFFEALCVHSLRVAGSALGMRAGHLRTKNSDHEVDLILEDPLGRILACEVKLAGIIADDDVKHLLWLREQLAGDLCDLVVFYTGQHAYRRPDGVAVIPISLLRITQPSQLHGDPTS